MKALYGQPELAEKERVRLQINAQVQEFLQRGGSIEVVVGNAKPATTDMRSVSKDVDELTLPYD